MFKHPVEGKTLNGSKLMLFLSLHLHFYENVMYTFANMYLIILFVETLALI